jgi:hypothetical protein
VVPANMVLLDMDTVVENNYLTYSDLNTSKLCQVFDVFVLQQANCTVLP